MISETEHQRHKVDLEFLKTTLENAAIQAELILASEKNPVSFISANLPFTYQGPKAAFQLIFIPAEGILEEVSLLQIYTYSEDKISEPNSELYEFLRLVNPRSLMGFFGIEDGEKRIFHRYVYSIPRFQVPNEKVFIETLELCIANFGNITSIIFDLANKKIPFQEAKNKLNG